MRGRKFRRNWRSRALGAERWRRQWAQPRGQCQGDVDLGSGAMQKGHHLLVAAIFALGSACLCASGANAQSAGAPLQLGGPVTNSSNGETAGTPAATAPDWNTTVSDAATAEARRKLEAQQRALDQSRQEEALLESGIEQLKREHSQVTDHLVETAKLVQESEAALSETESQLDHLNAKRTIRQAAFKQQRSQLAKLLGALQRMGRNPPPILATEREDALKMVRSAMQLAAVVPQLKDKALALQSDMSELDATILGIKTKNAQRLTEKQRLVDEQARLDALQQQKKIELAARSGDLTQLRDVVGEQAKTVASLSELISKADRAVAFRGTLGEADKQLQELQAPSEPEPEPVAVAAAAPQPAVTLPESRTSGPKTQVASTDRASGAALLPLVPGRNFERARGKLPLPVQGKRILMFGDPAKNVGRSKGEVYATRSDAQITSPCDGLIVYAGDFRIFGQILIINAGGGYHVLLAGLGQIDAVAGQSVVAGEPVGKMGAGTGASAVAAAGAPILYVEFRSKDKPINPSPWWANVAEKVQG